MTDETNHPKQKNEPYPFWLKGTLILLGLCLIVITLIHGRFILLPLAIAALIAMLLSPVIERLESWKLGRVISILAALSVIIIFLAGLVVLLTIQVVQFSDNLPEVAEKIKSSSSQGIQFIEGVSGIDEETLNEYLKNGINNLFDAGGGFLTSLADATKGTLIILGLLPIFIFFMLYYKEMYQTFLEETFKKSHNSEIDVVIKKVQKVTQNNLVGLFTVMGIMAILNTIGLLLLGLDYAIFFAVFAAFLAIIPYVGSILGAFPAVLYALLFGDSLILPLLVIGVFTTVQLIESNFITPKVIGSKVSINPFVAIIALLIGGHVWGIAGMVLFIPMIGILRVGFSQVEALEPYGYLLGNVIDYSESKRKAKK
jgi:predicted PurR-regulated permease PerM